MIRQVLLFVLLLFAGVALTQPRTFPVPLRTVNGMVLLEAAVNGRPPVLLLDTGANRTVLARRHAGTVTKMHPKGERGEFCNVGNRIFIVQNRRSRRGRPSGATRRGGAVNRLQTSFGYW